MNNKIQKKTGMLLVPAFSALSLVLLITMLNPAICNAQERKMDKAEADKILFEQLNGCNVVENWHADINIDADKLKKTDEEGLYIMPGKTFQDSGFSSDIYVFNKKGLLKIVFDKRFPLESATNLLLNAVKNNNLRLSLKQHQYGHVIKEMTIPLQTVYDVLARHNDMYCSVVRIDINRIEASLVFHHPGKNIIHMFLLEIPVNQLFVDNGLVTAELWGNIPQDNLKSLMKRDNEHK